MICWNGIYIWKLQKGQRDKDVTGSRVAVTDSATISASLPSDIQIRGPLPLVSSSANFSASAFTIHKYPSSHTVTSNSFWRDECPMGVWKLNNPQQEFPSQMKFQMMVKKLNCHSGICSVNFYFIVSFPPISVFWPPSQWEMNCFLLETCYNMQVGILITSTLGTSPISWTVNKTQIHPGVSENGKANLFNALTLLFGANNFKIMIIDVAVIPNVPQQERFLCVILEWPQQTNHVRRRRRNRPHERVHDLQIFSM